MYGGLWVTLCQLQIRIFRSICNRECEISFIMSAIIQWHLHAHITRYVKLRVAHAPGMSGMFSPPPNSNEPLVSDPSMHHGTCVTHVPWCMSGSLTRCGWENIPGILGASANRNFMCLTRGPWSTITRNVFGYRWFRINIKWYILSYWPKHCYSLDDLVPYESLNQMHWLDSFIEYQTCSLSTGRHGDMSKLCVRDLLTALMGTRAVWSGSRQLWWVRMQHVDIIHLSRGMN